MANTVDLNQQTQGLSASKKLLLAKWLEGAGVSEGIPARSDPSIAPLSSAQQRLWLLEQINPGSTVYNMHDAVRITGKINFDILEKVFIAIIERHEVLRTQFVFQNKTPIQKILKQAKFDLLIESVVGSENRVHAAISMIRDEIMKPFNLEEGSLFRVKIVRISEDDQILVWVMHHIISDGWSLGIIIKEVIALTKAFTSGMSSPLKTLPIQYGDFSEWESKQMNSENLEKQLDFWRKELEVQPPLLQLPYDRLRPDILSYKGSRIARVYPNSLVEKLKALSKKEESTFFMVLLTGFHVLLHRYSNSGCIHIGVPVANRSKEECHDLIGYFSNTVVIRALFSGNCSFSSLLEQIKSRSLAVFKNQDISFEKLVEELKPDRKLNATPLFQIMFVLQNEPMPVAESEGLVIKPIDIHNGTSKFDLLLNIFETDEGLNVGFEYSTDLFDQDTISRMLDHYRILLENISKNSSVNIEEIPMLSELEENQLLHEWGFKYKNYEAESPHLLHQLFERQVSLTPDALAVRSASTSLTYNELNGFSNKLAHYFMSQGLSQKAIVAVHLQPSFELLISLIAILKIGAVFLPLDQQYPNTRLSYMVQNSRAEFFIYKDCCPDWVDEASVRCLDINLEKKGSFPDLNLNIPVNPCDGAYIIYTSGTTGKPKGALNSHQAICNRLLWMQDEFNLSIDDRVLQKTPLAFDVSVWELFWPITTGSLLIFAPTDAHKDMVLLSETIDKNEITTLHFVPSVLNIFLKNKSISGLQSLRRVICSGEALYSKLVSQFKKKFSCDIYNLYGPTEAAIDVTYYHCSNDSGKTIVPIGRPIANANIYILDRHLHPVPQGVEGEIYIGGISVGEGYINSPTLTSERFVTNPFSFDRARHLYKTGDIARWSKNGIIDFIGRSDFQIKLNGARIEISEIEELISNVSEIEDVVVDLHSENKTEKSLVAYMTLKEDSKNHHTYVHTHVSEWEMVFNKFYANDDLPFHLEKNTASWISSYTNEPFPEEEMSEWVNSTIDRIMPKSAGKILEIGCGTGLLLFQLVKKAKSYVGTDVSEKALDYISEVLQKQNNLDKSVKLLKASASDFSEVMQYGPFDLVILNSVVQYFPSFTYLASVINGAVDLLAPGGSLFLGDIRNLDLNQELYLKSILAQEARDLSLNQLQRMMTAKRSFDQELSISPKLFHHSNILNEKIRSAKVMLRMGRFKNEMNCYRYDVFLETNPEPSDQNNVDECIWDIRNPSLFDLNGKLETGLTKPLLIKSIPNARVFHEVKFLQFIHNKDEELKIEDLETESGLINVNFVIDPNDLYTQWQDTYNVSIMWPENGVYEYFDAVFYPKSLGQFYPIKFFNTCNFDDLRKFVRIPGTSVQDRLLIKNIQLYLKKFLPDYMIPSSYVFLTEMPLSLNGKVDRSKLPKPVPFRITTQDSFIPPQTPLEKALASIWSDVLGITKIGVKDNFFDLGGNSLLASRLTLRLSECNFSKIPLRVLFQTPTIEQIAQYLQNNNENLLQQDKIQTDMAFPRSIEVNNKKFLNPPFSDVLLTGATGFLGAFLLNDLLRLSSANVYCLVRAKDVNEGLHRIKTNLTRYHLDSTVDWQRINVIIGDLSAPSFNLTEKEFSALAHQVEAIYHCAAAVNFSASYDQLRAANVLGTTELFRLATLTPQIKCFHLVSSIHVLTDEDSTANDLINEQANPKHIEKLSMGYLQTKAVSENLAIEARSKGIPVNIYRPGRIGGDARTGICQLDDFFWNLVSLCLKLSAIPDVEIIENIIPVDVVSESIVRLSFSSACINRNYHHISAQLLSYNLLKDVLQSYNYQLRTLSYDDWFSLVLDFSRREPEDPSVRFIGFLPDKNRWIKEPSFTNEETNKSLVDFKVQERSLITRDILVKYVGYFISEKFFPEPLDCKHYEEQFNA